MSKSTNHSRENIKNTIKLVSKTYTKKPQIQIKQVSNYENGRQRHKLPIKNIIVPLKTQEDFTSGIETRPGVTPPLWPPNQQMNINSQY